MVQLMGRVFLFFFFGWLVGFLPYPVAVGT